MDEMESRTWFFEYWKKGENRLKNTNFEHAHSRLEWVLEQNPDIDPDRLKIPPELQDIMYALNKTTHVDSFKFSAKCIAGGIACGAATFVGYYGALLLERMNSPSGDILSILSFGVFLVPILPGIQLAGYGMYSFVCGIKEYLDFRKEKWNRPPTPKERSLAEYVLMNDGK